MPYIRFSVWQWSSEYKNTLREVGWKHKGMNLSFYSCHVQLVLCPGIITFIIRKILQLRTHHEIFTLWCYKVFKENWLQGYLCRLLHVNVGIVIYSLLLLLKNKYDMVMTTWWFWIPCPTRDFSVIWFLLSQILWSVVENFKLSVSFIIFVSVSASMIIVLTFSKGTLPDFKTYEKIVIFPSLWLC